MSDEKKPKVPQVGVVEPMGNYKPAIPQPFIEKLAFPPGTKTPEPEEGLGTVEHWAVVEATPEWLFRSAKVKHHWGVAKQLTLQNYRSLIDDTANGRTGPTYQGA